MDFMLRTDIPWIDISGKWDLEMKLPDGSSHKGEMELPGTTALYWLAIEKEGRPYTDPLEAARRIALNMKPEEGFLTEKYPFAGEITLSRDILPIELKEDELAILYLERTRITRVWLDGKEIDALDDSADSLVGAHVYDLTPAVTGGAQKLRIQVANVGYPTKGGHMTSPDTQTNWCGITGRMRILKKKKGLTVDRLSTGLSDDGRSGRVTVIVNNPESRELKGSIRILVEKPETGDAATEEGAEKEKEILAEVQVEGTFPPGESEHQVLIPLGEDPAKEICPWEEGEEPAPRLYCLNCILTSQGAAAGASVTSSIRTGFRRLTTDHRKMLLNGHPVFLRGKHDGLVFPLTGAAPTDKATWIKVLRTAKNYGINHYRFHTCCPPEAAFSAADEVGILMCPELPFWGTIHGKDDPDFNGTEQEYLIREGERMLKQFGHHPSFVMLSLGNELWGSAERLGEIIRRLKKIRPDILMTQGSNNFQFMPCVLPEDDYFSGVRFSRNRLFRGSYAMCDAPLGPVQTREPGTDWDYDEVILGRDNVKNEAEEAGDEIEIQFGTGVKKVSKEDAGEDAGEKAELIPDVPVISHEIGQYAMYPDIRRENKYTGVLRADYFSIYRDRLKQKGLQGRLDDMIRDSGALSVYCYKLELEAALRSEELSGFQLLDLQDFPGQGGAFVGVLDAFMDEKCEDYDAKSMGGKKPLIRPEEWRQFCGPAVILARIPRFVWTDEEEIPVKIDIRQMDRFHGVGKDTLTVKLLGENMTTNLAGAKYELYSESFPVEVSGIGLTRAAEFTIDLKACSNRIRSISRLRTRYKLILETEGSKLRNEYELWLLPELSDPEEVRRSFSEAGIQIAETKEEYAAALRTGGKVLYLPDEVARGIRGDYPSDFWCYPMFRSISEWMKKEVPVGTLGISVSEKGNNRVVGSFTAGNYADFQRKNRWSTPLWYKIISHSTPAILDDTDAEVTVRMTDNMERNHNLGLIFSYGIGDEESLFGTTVKTSVMVCAAPLLRMTQYPEVRLLLKDLLTHMTSNDFRPAIAKNPWKNEIPVTEEDKESKEE